MAKRIYADANERSRVWRSKHQVKSRATSKRWRDRNREVMALLNRRNKLHRQLVFEWVREQWPDVFKRLKKESWQRLPVCDLELEREERAQEKGKGKGKARGKG